MYILFQLESIPLQASMCQPWQYPLAARFYILTLPTEVLTGPGGIKSPENGGSASGHQSKPSVNTKGCQLYYPCKHQCQAGCRHPSTVPKITVLGPSLVLSPGQNISCPVSRSALQVLHASRLHGSITNRTKKFQVFFSIFNCSQEIRLYLNISPIIQSPLILTKMGWTRWFATGGTYFIINIW